MSSMQGGMMRNAMIPRIYEETNQIMKLVISCELHSSFCRSEIRIGNLVSRP